MKIMLANFCKLVDDKGGMAKVTIDMANEFIRRGHDVSLVYSDVKIGEFFFPINDKVHCYDLRHFRGQEIKFPLKLVVKREWHRLCKDHLKTQGVTFRFLSDYLSDNLNVIMNEEKPDIIISSNLGTSNVFFEMLQTKVPMITMSHGDPIYYFSDTPGYVLESFRKSVFCQVLLNSHAKNLLDNMPEANVVVIGNASPGYELAADLGIQKDVHKVVFIGGLIKGIKRPHLLIEAFAKLYKDNPSWIVELWGPEERPSYLKELQLRIKKLGLESCVFIKGTTKEVEKVLSEADIFVSTSRAEGFPLTLTEAMSKGVPVIGYKNCTGVKDLIVSDYNGYLVDDGIDDLAAKLLLLMKNKDKRITFGKNARESIKQYSPEAVWGKWEEIIRSSIEKL